MKNKFTDEDKQKVIELLNFIAEKANFNDAKNPWKTADSIKHFKLLSHMQHVILPKIEDNILEVKELVSLEEKSEVEI